MAAIRATGAQNLITVSGARSWARAADGFVTYPVNDGNWAAAIRGYWTQSEFDAGFLYCQVRPPLPSRGCHKSRSCPWPLEVHIVSIALCPCLCRHTPAWWKTLALTRPWATRWQMCAFMPAVVTPAALSTLRLRLLVVEHATSAKLCSYSPQCVGMRMCSP